jgi:hypothetical protein
VHRLPDRPGREGPDVQRLQPTRKQGFSAALGRRNEPPPRKSLPGIAATTYAPVVKVSDTIEWITARQQENPAKPWFVWLAFNLSHATMERAPSQMAVPHKDALDETS